MWKVELESVVCRVPIGIYLFSNSRTFQDFQGTSPGKPVYEARIACVVDPWMWFIHRISYKKVRAVFQ